MVVASRFGWLRQCIERGEHVRLHIGAADDAEKCKIRATVEPHRNPLTAASRETLLATLDTLANACGKFIVVDRGHKYTSGASEACFWLRPHRTGDGRDTDNVDDDDDDDDGNMGGDSNGDNTPAGHDENRDPWQDGGDPWSQGGHAHRFNGHVSKKPRQQGYCSASKVVSRGAVNDGKQGLSSKIDILDGKLDLVLAGMSLAIGPGFKKVVEESKTSPSGNEQPDFEPSPEKAVFFPDGCLVFDIADDHCEKGDSADSHSIDAALQCTCTAFDIATQTMPQSVEAEMQSAASTKWEPIVLDVACQTRILPRKPRKARCNGRAVQTSSGDISSNGSEVSHLMDAPSLPVVAEPLAETYPHMDERITDSSLCIAASDEKLVAHRKLLARVVIGKGVIEKIYEGDPIPEAGFEFVGMSLDCNGAVKVYKKLP